MLEVPDEGCLRQELFTQKTTKTKKHKDPTKHGI